MKAGPGRPKGVPNKLSRIAKDNIADVFEELGGIAEMKKWAQDNPTEFYRIYARLIPVEQVHSGSIAGNYIQIPTEQRDIDAVASAAGAAANGHSTQPH